MGIPDNVPVSVMKSTEELIWRYEVDSPTRYVRSGTYKMANMVPEYTALLNANDLVLFHFKQDATVVLPETDFFILIDFMGEMVFYRNEAGRVMMATPIITEEGLDGHLWLKIAIHPDEAEEVMMGTNPDSYAEHMLDVLFVDGPAAESRIAMIDRVLLNDLVR